MRRIVITGAGIASSLGNRLRDFWKNLYAGKCGIRSIQPGRQIETTFAGFLSDIPRPKNISEQKLKFLSDLSKLALFCCEKALKSSGLDPSQIISSRSGVYLGSGFLNLYDLERHYFNYFEKGIRAVSPITIPLNMANAPASQISIRYGLKGLCQMVSSACSSGSSAIVESFRLIKNGDLDLIICGGLDLMNKSSILAGWEKMRILSKEKENPSNASLPFHKDRVGLVLGEGGALFILENLEHADKRKAHVFAEITGAFQNSDAAHQVKPSQDGEEACLRKVLEESHLAPSDIDCIQAHGTATRLNDETEARSLSEIFKEHLKNIPISAIKSQIGHTMGASGPLAVAAALGTFEEGYLYPLPHLNRDTLDPDLPDDMNFLSKGRKEFSVKNVLINTFAFGGSNTALILSKFGHIYGKKKHKEKTRIDH